MSTATEPEATPEPETAERPEWLPSQFQTPETLAKSWREASQKISRQGTQLSELAAENQQLTEELERLLAAREALAARISSLEAAFIASMAGAR